MTIKLWIDDERNPSCPMIQEMFGSIGNEVWVKTANEAIEYIKNNEVVSISFDHDLGPESAGTGMDVALWIEESAYNKEIPKIEWRIHSMNPIGRINITKSMNQADKFWSM